MNIILKIGIDVYQLLIELGFNYKQAQYITAQAAHETGNFQSQIFKENNNLFGMKHAGQRLSQGEKNGHAYYKTIEDSVKDYQIYYKLNNYPVTFETPENFVDSLKNHGYFEANIENYKKGVRHFLNLYFNA